MNTTSQRLIARRTVLAGVVAASGLLMAGCSVTQGTTSSSASSTPAAAVKPVVKAVVPATASVSQQRTVQITGTGLANVKSVDFGGVAGAVTSVQGSKVVVTAPVAAGFQAATVPITLRDAKGNVIAHKNDVFSYTATTGVDTQLQYALAHWNNYNTAEYGDLNPVGGDCANFVSQTLIARGWTMNDDWYNHDAAADWSPAWGFVPAMDVYFSDNADSLGLQQLSFDQRSQVALGDVAIFDWDGDGSPDHVQVVTAIKKSGDSIAIEMASHNDDFDYRDLDTTITTQHPGATGHFWHLTR
jgi:hypothetical protein